MQKFLRWALGLALCLGLSVGVALADDAPAIAVQLDGQLLTFPDAVPQAQDQRTFLPFRTVFEAMGAQVDSEGSVITAVRGDRILTMTLDQATATVTENGVVTPIVMDVAPYVDPATWRTYVPVRFAAQAFGCAVGWDQEAQTVIIIDTQRLLEQVTQGRSYTYLDQFNTMRRTYETGIWDASATLDANVVFTSPSSPTPPLTFSITGGMAGTSQDREKMDLDMTIKLDVSELMELSLSEGGERLTAGELKALAALREQGIGLSVRGDITNSKAYINVDPSALGDLAADAVVNADTWYEVDLSQLGRPMDDAFAQLLPLPEMDPISSLRTNLFLAQPNDVDDHQESKAMLEELFSALSDQGFVDGPDGKTAQWTLHEEEAGITISWKLTLLLEKDVLAACTVSRRQTYSAPGLSSATSGTVSLDQQGQVSSTYRYDMDGYLSMSIDLEGAYAPGSLPPAITPPENAAVAPSALANAPTAGYN